MYKNIIKLAAIAAKDTPSAIMKKLRKLDPRFVQDRDLEIESYLSRRSSLSFDDFSVLLEDCYARYAIEEEFINRFTDDPEQRHVMYEEIKLSVPELRKCGPQLNEVIRRISPSYGASQRKKEEHETSSPLTVFPGCRPSCIRKAGRPTVMARLMSCLIAADESHAGRYLPLQSCREYHLLLPACSVILLWGESSLWPLDCGASL